MFSRSTILQVAKCRTTIFDDAVRLFAPKRFREHIRISELWLPGHAAITVAGAPSDLVLIKTVTCTPERASAAESPE